MAALRAQIHHLAAFDTIGSPHVPTLLLRGETGTGKGFVARVIHDSGPRAAGPYIEVNCAAIPENMLEAELFGFEAGAFTDAKRAKPGLFEAAVEGTLFLDEVDALPLALQGKLLTSTETKRVRRLGAVAERLVDVKLIAATNAILEQRVATGRFRGDLYHRLAVVVLTLPPLRERGNDLLELAETFLRRYTTAHGVQPKRLSAAAEAWLKSYAWPGNVRELSHVMERVTLLHMGAEVDVVTLKQLCLSAAVLETPGEGLPAVQEPTSESTLPSEAEQIRQALVQTGGNVVRAARLLSMSRDALRYRMQRYDITRPRLKAASRPASPLPPSPKARTSSPQSENLPPAEQPLSPAPTSTIGWEQKPVAVLAVELTWPEIPAPRPPRYDAWTETARREQAIAGKVHGFGGTLMQRTASLLVWVFGLPQVLEQLPQRAVHAALVIRQMVAAAMTPDVAPCPDVRLAVHLGSMRVDRLGADQTARALSVGETLALPVRLLGQAEPWAIVVSPEVGRLVEGWVALEERPLRSRAGDPTRLGGYAVMGVSPSREVRSAHRPAARRPFVGRDQELLLLEAILEQAKAGHGQVVSLVGPPGMGKSRLLEEFRQRFTGQRVRYAAGQCLAYGHATPYLPIVDLLRDHCEIAVDDGPEVYLTKVRANLQQTGLDLDASLPYLLHLLGLPADADWLAKLSAEARKTRTFEAVRQLFLTGSQQQPLILAVEDLQWIDPTSETLLGLLVDGLAGAAILLLATFRPGYRPLWLDKSYATQIALQPLGPEDSGKVVRNVVRGTSLNPAMEQQLLVRAEGNPFFLEELAYTWLEQNGQSPVLTVPDTVQAVIAARIDRLPPDEKQLLQAAAVIGKAVSTPLLQALTALPQEALSQRLAHLQAAEFLTAAGSFPDTTYTFRHMLIQETAYQGLFTGTRQQYHQQVAQVLAEHFPELAETQPELLAHHYTEAGSTAQAILHWQRAGQRAIQRSANQEAIAHLTTALDLLKMLPDTEVRIQQELVLLTSLGAALIAVRGYASPEVAHVYARARDLCRRMEDTTQLFPALRGLQMFHAVRAELQTAWELAEELLSLAQRQQDSTLNVSAYLALGTILFHSGAVVQARGYLEQGIPHDVHPSEHDPAFLYGRGSEVVCVSWAALALWLLGYPEQALQKSRQALTWARELAHPFSLAFALNWAAWLHQLRREPQVAQARAEAAMALCATQGFAQLLALGQMVRGWALAVRQQSEDGIIHIRQGMMAYQATGAAVGRPHSLTLLAEAYGHIRQADLGLACLAEALTVVGQTGERVYEAELHRLTGELLLMRSEDHQAATETCHQQALEVARHQQAKTLELRAAMSLSRLWLSQGRRDAARQLLAPIYSWFTEGFDTADLQEAQALLTALE